VIKLSEVLQSAQSNFYALRQERSVALDAPAFVAFAESIVEHVNAEFEMLRALIRPDSTLEQQIAEREADRAELAQLMADELRDHLEDFTRRALRDCVTSVRASDDPNAELARLELLFGLPAIKLVRAALTH
jgi:hypothetical protein